jgi:UV excision repair protein RAD23
VSLSSLNLKESDFLVVMARKPKAGAAPKAAAPPSTPTPAPQPVAATPVAAPQPAIPAPAAASPAPASAPAAAPKAGEAAPAPATAADSEQELKIASLMDMGFPRGEAEAALRAAFNHAERAVEYLFNGIPANLASQSAAPAKAAGAPPKGTAASTPAAPAQDPLAAVLAGNGPAPSSGQSDGPLSFLRSHPDFNAMKLAVQQNPQVLQQIMGALYQSNPQLVQLISQNQEEFTRLLEEPVDPEALARSQLLKRFNGDEDDEDDASGGGGVPPGVIQVTPAEKEAIDRLEGMGFPRAKAIEAYFACDKNEELAANYLLEHGFDDQQ